MSAQVIVPATDGRSIRAAVRTDVYVTRHAEVHNPKDILYGRLPRFGLSETGIKQAESVARFLSGRPIDAMYTSPLLRARQTARIIAKAQRGIPVHRSGLIIEVKSGYQGSPNAIMTPGFSFYEPKREPEDESMEAVFNRISRFLRSVVLRHAGQAVVAVSHADPIAIMRLGLLGTPLTVANLHSTAYPMRASVNLVTLGPDHDPVITYFNVAGERS